MASCCRSATRPGFHGFVVHRLHVHACMRVRVRVTHTLACCSVGAQTSMPYGAAYGSRHRHASACAATPLLSRTRRSTRSRSFWAKRVPRCAAPLRLPTPVPTRPFPTYGHSVNARSDSMPGMPLVDVALRGRRASDPRYALASVRVSCVPGVRCTPGVRYDDRCALHATRVLRLARVRAA